MKYRVRGYIEEFRYYEVDADSEQEAMDIVDSGGGFPAEAYTDFAPIAVHVEPWNARV